MNNFHWHVEDDDEAIASGRSAPSKARDNRRTAIWVVFLAFAVAMVATYWTGRDEGPRDSLTPTPMEDVDALLAMDLMTLQAPPQTETQPAPAATGTHTPRPTRTARVQPSPAFEEPTLAPSEVQPLVPATPALSTPVPVPATLTIQPPVIPGSTLTPGALVTTTVTATLSITTTVTPAGPTPTEGPNGPYPPGLEATPATPENPYP